MTVARISVYTELADFICSTPSLIQLVEFRLSHATEERINYLLDANRSGILTGGEQAELDEAIRVEHLMRLIKIRAIARLDAEQ